jgi:hypothetical protein
LNGAADIVSASPSCERRRSIELPLLSTPGNAQLRAGIWPTAK